MIFLYFLFPAFGRGFNPNPRKRVENRKFHRGSRTAEAAAAETAGTDLPGQRVLLVGYAEGRFQRLEHELHPVERER